jgi:hypothetical protein
MIHRRLMLLVVVSAGLLSGALLSAGPAVGAENPLEGIPDGAGVLLRFRTPQSSMQKAAALAAKVHPQWGQVVQAQPGSWAP